MHCLMAFSNTTRHELEEDFILIQFFLILHQDQGSTTFKGGRKPCPKECILIIDKQTGVSFIFMVF